MLNFVLNYYLSIKPSHETLNTTKNYIKLVPHIKLVVMYHSQKLKNSTFSVCPACTLV